MTDDVVSEDVALSEFERFCEAMALDIDESQMDEEDKRGLAKARGVFVKAVREGKLVVIETGEPVLTLSTGEQLTFHEPTGSTYSQGDQAKKDHSFSKLFLMMAELTKTSAAKFKSMRQRDLKICQTITLLFFS